MQTYEFKAHGRAVTLSDTEVVRNLNFGVKRRYARADILAVTVEGVERVNKGAVAAFGVLAVGARKRTAAMTITTKAGEVIRIDEIKQSAVEVANQFALRGYPVNP